MNAEKAKLFTNKNELLTFLDMFGKPKNQKDLRFLSTTDFNFYPCLVVIAVLVDFVVVAVVDVFLVELK